jgi:DNA repair protein RadC
METNMKIREVKVSYVPANSNLPVIRTSKDAFTYLQAFYDPNTIGLHEQFMVLLVNRANRVLGCYQLSKGGLTGTVVDTRILFGTALKALASGLILAHNHPSNNLKPSEEDRKITSTLISGGKLLDITILDHLILGTENNYISFADEGWLQ